MRRSFLFLLVIPQLLLAQITRQEVSYVPQDGDTLTGEWMKVENPRLMVLIIPGSGPTTRDGNSRDGSLKNDALKKLAQGLAKQGISSFRIDKRGAGTKRSNRADSTISVDLFVEDVLGWMVTLEAMEGAPFEAFIGHSQGSLIAMLSAEKAKIPKVVSIAGAGEPITEVLKYQMGMQIKGEAMEVVREKLDSIRLGYSVNNNIYILRGLFHPEAQRFLRTWAKYDPCDEIERFKGKVLIVQGGRDLQVTEDQGERLRDCDPDASYLFLPEMNHVLTNAPESISGNLKTYGQPELPLTPGLVEGITGFLFLPH
ncbi:MAG: alpha/beta hydrolase [Bacteroidota bacterium]|nr:alpha/beta hydrolase [Bacteroidota bacterium]